ncbi:tetratricopeptide repeat protein [Streptomyces caeruleatus]|nr:tetratricopeptide repeat protein [Streptomyces caeruleatus]
MHTRGRQSVTAGGDIGVAVTGDHNQLLLAPAVRSAYWEQVHRIAPLELVDRADELSDLADFCTADSGPAYTWWRAGAWAGKTALMAWFALHPPPGVRIVPFFVTARLGAQNDATAYVDVVLEQLAEIAGEGLPAYLTQSTRDAHLLRLYGEATRACAARGERLVLLVDGLDEDRGVTTRSGTHSIAGLLPARTEAGMRVMVAGRLNPPLPVDVPDDHPLRDPGIVRLLRQSPHAQAIRAEAEKELKQLIEDGGLEYDLLALVTAAGGGLTAEDLAELTRAVPYRVRDVLRTRAGRTFAVRVDDVYLLGHEELQAQAEDMLSAAELSRYRQKLYAWADEWAARGWPDGTPHYLLRGYFRMLWADGDLDRMLRCALDEARHDRMLLLTGGDVAAVNEVRATEELLAERETASLLDALRLAVHRDRLGDRNAGLPEALPATWAAMGGASRALALARSLPDAYRRGMELASIAEELLDRGDDHGQALEVCAEAEDCAARCDERTLGDVVRLRVSLTLLKAGQYERAAGLARDAVGSGEASRLYAAAVAACMADGRREQAEQLVRDAPDEACGGRALAAVVSALVEDGLLEEAERVARTAPRPVRCRSLVVAAVARARSGDRRRADALMEQAKRLTRTGGRRIDVVQALVLSGDMVRAQVVGEAINVRVMRDKAREIVALRLVRDGDHDRAEARLVSLSEEGFAAVSRNLAEALARQGEFDRAEELARGIPEDEQRVDAVCQIVGCMAEAGSQDRAAEVARSLNGAEAQARALVQLAAGLSRAGRSPAAEKLLLEIESSTRVPSAPLAAQKLSQAAVALCEAGAGETARRLVDGIEDLFPPTRMTALTAEAAALRHAVTALACVREVERAQSLLARHAPPEETAELRVALIRRCAAVGEVESARRLVRASALPDRGDSPERIAFVRGLTDGGRWSPALAEARGLSDLNSEYRELSRIAWGLYKAGQHDRARAVINEVLQRTRRLWTFNDANDIFLLKTLSAVGRRDAVMELTVRSRVMARYRSRRPQNQKVNHEAQLMVALGDFDAAVAHTELLSDPHERARIQEEITTALADAGTLDRAEHLAQSIGVPSSAARACVHVALVTTDAGQARRMTTVALRAGGWAPALPGLLKLAPEAVPLVVETAEAMRAACLPGHQVATAARTSAPSAS